MSAHREIPNQTRTVFLDEILLELTLSGTGGVSEASKWKKVTPGKDSKQYVQRQRGVKQ